MRPESRPAAGAPGRHRVLLFIPHLDQGGAERQMLELLRHLADHFEPILVVAEDVTHYRDLLPPGQPRYTLGGGLGPSTARRLAGIIREVKPHILHSYRDKANFWARLATLIEPVPVVLTSCRNRIMLPMYMASEPLLSRISDRVLTNSEGVRRELITFARVDPDKVQVIHNFIDVAAFHPPTPAQRTEARRRWELADDEVALVLPGRISGQKHQLGLMLALWQLRRRGVAIDRVRVLLAGRERDRWVAAALPRWISMLGVDGSVRRLGPVSDILGLYHAADGLVMPSLFEGLPNAVLEAHACGLPAVVSHAANIDRIVLDGESGFEVPTFDHGALATAIGRLVARSPAERQQMGAVGRDHVARTFSTERVLEETVGLYHRLLAEKGLR